MFVKKDIPFGAITPNCANDINAMMHERLPDGCNYIVFILDPKGRTSCFYTIRKEIVAAFVVEQAEQMKKNPTTLL